MRDGGGHGTGHGVRKLAEAALEFGSAALNGAGSLINAGVFPTAALGTCLNGGGSLVDAGVGGIAALGTLNDLLSALCNTLSALLDALGCPCDLLSALLDALRTACDGACAGSQLIYTGKKLVGTGDELTKAVMDAALQIGLDQLCAVDKLGCALRQVADTGLELIQADDQLACAGIQGAGAVGQIAGAVCQFRGAVLQSGSAVRQLLGAVFQVACAVIQRFSAVCQLIRAVLQIARAVVQLLGAVYQLGGGVGQLIHGLLQIIKGLNIFQIQFVQKGVFRNGNGGQEGEVGDIRLDGDGLGDVDVNRIAVAVLQFIQTQALLETGHGQTDYNGLVAGVDDLAVGDLHIADLAVVQHSPGDHGKGLIEGDGLAVYHPLCGGVVDVVEGHDQMAGGALQQFRRHVNAVQRIGDVGSDGEGGVRAALIVDVAAVCLPDQIAVCVGGVGFAAFDILNAGEGGAVGNGIGLLRVFQPGADDGSGRIAVGIGDDIDRLLLALGAAVGAEQRGGGLSQCVRLRRGDLIGGIALSRGAAAGQAADHECAGEDQRQKTFVLCIHGNTSDQD